MIETQHLTTDDILHGYTADGQYNQEDMEEDGEYSKQLDWEYSEFGMVGSRSTSFPSRRSTYPAQT